MLQVNSEKIPIAIDEMGVLRVADTRVPLDSIVDLFDSGASPEEIVDQFDTLKLADVYAVITYYLRHRDEVRTHLAGEDRKAREERERIEAEFSNRPLTERLRRIKKERKGSEG
jgi:uncharacterized protein (DUF433 family)